MLHNLSLIPVRSYSRHLDRRRLAAWKFRLLLRFYGTRSTAEDGVGIVNSVTRGLRGLGEGGHDSKLPTAFRNAAGSLWHTLRTRFTKGWMPRVEEAALFEGWDAIYREIRRQRLAAGVSAPAPRDTRELHRRNIVVALRRDHQTPRTVSWPGSSSKAAAAPVSIG